MPVKSRRARSRHGWNDPTPVSADLATALFLQLAELLKFRRRLMVIDQAHAVGLE